VYIYQVRFVLQQLDRNLNEDIMIRLLLLVLIWLFSISISAVAAEKDSALAAFEAGTEQFKAGDYIEAADSFRKANELRPNWKLYYNIGQSEAAAKRHGLALEAFETYLSKGGDDIQKDRVEELEHEIDRLRKIVGFIQISAPAGAVVHIDEMPRGETPLPGALMVAAGVVHQVRVGDLPSRTVKVAGQQTASVNFAPPAASTTPSDTTVHSELRPTTEPSAEGTTSRPEHRNKMKTSGFITLGLGAAALIGGAVTGGLALSANEEVKRNCDGGCYSDNYDLLDRADHLALSTDVLIGVGSVAAVVGAVLVVLAKKKPNEAATVHVQPVFSASGGGLIIEGRF